MTKVARDTVVFDLGGVLIDWDPRHLYRKLFAGNEGDGAFPWHRLREGGARIDEDGEIFVLCSAAVTREEP
jgi:FMN phosphatase YigB (HAD superfamily)